MAKQVLIAQGAVGLRLSIGKDVVVLDETLPLAAAQIIAAKFPQYITLKDTKNEQTPTGGKAEIVKASAISQPIEPAASAGNSGD